MLHELKIDKFHSTISQIERVRRERGGGKKRECTSLIQNEMNTNELFLYGQLTGSGI